MASPQIEDGYTKIANKLLDALAKIRISGEARQILDLIFRKTYGFNKVQDRISLTQFMKGTGLSKVAVSKGVKKLQKMNLILLPKKVTKNKIFKINKDFDTWLPLPKKVTKKLLPKKVISVTKKGNYSLPKKSTTKETLLKETLLKKKTSSNPKADLEHFELLWKQYPNKAGKKRSESFYRNSVKSDVKRKEIEQALLNYKKHLSLPENSFKKPQNGSTWFNNWTDWIDYTECEYINKHPTQGTQKPQSNLEALKQYQRNRDAKKARKEPLND